MTPVLGSSIILAGLLAAVSGSALSFVAGYRRDEALTAKARWFAYFYGATMVGANLLMMWALYKRDFSVHYVAEVGSHSVPDHIAIISLWSSLNGSILFWGGVLGLFVIGTVKGLGNRHPEYLPYTLGTLLAVSVFFTLLIASIANPFEPVPPPIPMDGPGPNPLLQNHILMAVHPPFLYFGYVGMAVPFAMACAALLAGRLESGWMAPMRVAMLVPWSLLTVGIVLGGWWSYEVLGWGGYWAWDPVENASFMPWLTGTAFLHSAMVMERRGQLKNWTLTLGMASFLLTLLGTFMTRSGVFNSVHSFTQSEIGPIFLGMIAFTFGASVLLLAFRSHLLVDEDDGGSKIAIGLGAPRFRGSPWSRDVAMLLQNLLFSVYTFTVLVGVLYPLVMEGWFGVRVTVGQPYFDEMAVPLSTALVFLMGVGPALPWGGVSAETAGKRLAIPVGVGLALVALGAAFSVFHPWVMLALFTSGFALGANASEYVEPVLARMKSKKESAGAAMSAVFSRGRRRFGGHVAHFGVIMAAVAIAMSSAYKVEKDAVLRAGEAVVIGDWSASWIDTTQVREPHRTATVARFNLSRAGQAKGVIEPRLNYYDRMGEPVGTPAVHIQADGDVYMSLLQVDPNGQFVSIRVMTMPLVVWFWVSPLFIVLGTAMALWPARRKAEAPAVSAVVAVP